MAALDHIIVLMMENNSFDRMLGGLLPERPGGGGTKGSVPDHWNDDHTKNPPTRHFRADANARGTAGIWVMTSMMCLFLDPGTLQRICHGLCP